MELPWISTRLVANQKHTDIPAMLNAYMEANAPEGMDWEVCMGFCMPLASPSPSPRLNLGANRGNIAFFKKLERFCDKTKNKKIEVEKCQHRISSPSRFALVLVPLIIKMH